MTGFVESNFVLAVALGQEDAGPATTILELAERGRLDLAFPALAVVEPFSTVTQRGRGRRRVRTALDDQIRELDRSAPHRDLVSVLRPIPEALAGVERLETELLQATVRRLLAIGRSIALDATVFDQALRHQDLNALSPQDAIVYASVVSDLARRSPARETCFVSKNWRDFGNPEIVAELRSRRCAYAGGFRAALDTVGDWHRPP